MADAPLARRERQIMDVLYERGPCSVGEVHAALPDPPGRSSVRTLLRILEEKGHAVHSERGREYVYKPRGGKAKAARTEIKRAVDVFYDGSVADAVQGYLGRGKLPAEEAKKLAAVLKAAK